MGGLAFKPSTDDMREGSSLTLIADLLAAGATVTVYDPVAMHEAQRVLGENDRIHQCRRAGHRDRVERIPQPRL